jgi:predicted O-methyltransferase YrrM
MNSISLPLFRALFGWQHHLALDGKYADKNDRQVLNTLNAFRQPARVLEIGINEGRTAELLLRTSPWIKHYCGIDVFDTFVPALAHQRLEIPKNNSVAHLVKDPRLHTVMSTIGTYDGVQQLTGRDYNFIFIDADHSFEGVARDTAIARSVAAPGATLVWHDYASDLPDVMRFLTEHAVCENIIHVQNTRIVFQFLPFITP